MHRLRLAAERVEAAVVEVSRGEGRVPLGREAPRAVIEALTGDGDIVAVEHSVDEAGRHVARGKPGGGAGDEIEEAQRVGAGVVRRRLAVQMGEAVADQPGDVV